VTKVFRNEGPLENEKWEVDKEGVVKYVTEDGLTDAFGEIKFIDSGDNIAKVYPCCFIEKKFFFI
jgi:hypothetical protein